MDLLATPRSPGRTATGARRAALLALAGLALAGCGVRVETPPPPAPTPGPLEIVRQDAAETSLELSHLAARAAEETLDEELFAVLERTRLEAEAHLEALGGVYSAEEGGVVDPSTLTEESEGAEDEEDAAGDGEEAPAPVTPGELLAELVDSAAYARTAADSVEDAGLAQLLAVIASSRLVEADTIARAVEAEDRPDLSAAPPLSLPAGVPVSAIEKIVLAEDQARFAFESIAARSPEGGTRNRALASSARHRVVSDTWARLAGLSEPGLDPRQVVYALEGSLADAASRKELAARIEQALVESYAALVALAEPGSRAELAALHTEAVGAARRWGLVPSALPGLPSTEDASD